ncbi:MAG: hypothetical protein QW543_07505 [Sulfolobales archaeon]
MYLVVAQEFGGLRTDLLLRFCRIYDCSLSNVMVARAFSNSEVREILSGLEVEGASVVLAYPYSFLPRDPSEYWEATAISGLIARVSQRNRTFIFNTYTKFGDKLPEGGSMHHHVVKVIVKLVKQGSRVLAELVKHPGKPSGALAVFHVKLLEDIALLEKRKTLLDWVTRKQERAEALG